MNIQTNLNKAVSSSLVALTATSLSFATITPVKAAFAQVKVEPLITRSVINEGMNGTWNLQWKVNGLLYKGRLKMNGNFGTMVVNVTRPNGTRVYVEQQMNMHRQRNGYTLQGNRPTYPGRDAINRNYQPDNFYVELDDSGHLKMKNCSDDSGYIPVRMKKVY